MVATIKSFRSIPLLTAEEALTLLYGRIESAQVKLELYKWFAFGKSEKGSRLSGLSPEQFAIFLDKLPDLILILYNYQLETRKEARDDD